MLTEEFRVANAPTRVYFTADRQSGPTIIRYGTESIKNDILPRIVKGEISFCIGMSEPNSGSDLFAAKTRATKVDGGYLINGTKIWTSNAHQSDYMIGLFRTVSRRQPDSVRFTSNRLGRRMFTWYLFQRLAIRVTPDRITSWPGRDFDAEPRVFEVRHGA